MSDYKIGSSERGVDVLHDPGINKSTGYTEAERQALGLAGLVPDVTESTRLSSPVSCCNSRARPPTWTASST